MDDTATLEDREPTRPAEPSAVVDARDLFGERREIWIEWEGARYCLRITRRKRLILTK